MLTDDPWWVMAETDARAVVFPADSVARVLEIAERYHAEYLIVQWDPGWGPQVIRGWPRRPDGSPGLVRVEEAPTLRLYRIVGSHADTTEATP